MVSFTRIYSRACYVTVFVCGYAQFDTLPLLYVLLAIGVGIFMLSSDLYQTNTKEQSLGVVQNETKHWTLESQKINNNFELI